MKIIINKRWVVETDGLNWTLGNPKLNKGKQTIAHPTYHPTLALALMTCYERRLIGDETKDIILDLSDKVKREISMTKLVKLINDIKEEIIKAVEKE